MLQICQPPSFVSNSLSIPFPKDRRQVFLDCHLLSVAAVAVCEDPIWVSLGEGLWAVIQHFPPAVGETRGGSHYQHTNTWCIHKTHPRDPPICTACGAKSILFVFFLKKENHWITTFLLFDHRPGELWIHSLCILSLKHLLEIYWQKQAAW